MAEVFGQATSFSIAELTGQKRKLTLAGRAQPYRPVSFSGKQEAEFTHYPGNPHKTVQVLGADEGATTVRGKWKDRFLKSVDFLGGISIPTAIAKLNNTQVADVKNLTVLVDSIRRQGQLCEVTWAHLKRQGILIDFVQTWDYITDCEWEMTFQWISQGDEAAPAVLSSSLDLGNVNGSWQIIKDVLATAAANPPFEQTTLFRNAVSNQITTIDNSADEVVGTVSNVVIAATDVSDGIRRMSSISDAINQQSQDLKNEVSTMTAESDRFNLPVDTSLGFPSFTSRLSAQAYSRGLYDAARTAQSQAVIQRDDFTTRLDPTLIGSFIARDQQDLRDVSTAFYGSPDNWGDLLEFNQLTTSKLTSGQVVFVPKLATVQA